MDNSIPARLSKLVAPKAAARNRYCAEKKTTIRTKRLAPLINSDELVFSWGMKEQRIPCPSNGGTGTMLRRNRAPFRVAPNINVFRINVSTSDLFM